MLMYSNEFKTIPVKTIDERSIVDTQESNNICQNLTSRFKDLSKKKNRILDNELKNFYLI